MRVYGERRKIALARKPVQGLDMAKLARIYNNNMRVSTKPNINKKKKKTFTIHTHVSVTLLAYAPYRLFIKSHFSIPVHYVLCAKRLDNIPAFFVHVRNRGYAVLSTDSQNSVCRNQTASTKTYCLFFIKATQEKKNFFSKSYLKLKNVEKYLKRIFQINKTHPSDMVVRWNILSKTFQKIVLVWLYWCEIRFFPFIVETMNPSRNVVITIDSCTFCCAPPMSNDTAVMLLYYVVELR